MLSLQQVERDSLGVVSLQQLLPLGVETGQPGALASDLGRLLALGALGQIEYCSPEGLAHISRQDDRLPQLGHPVLDHVHGHVGLRAA
ncbi:hypothetical protein [Miltoncostaea oceani]|uniref:hypothetical protein n=1 Tax=Miltoncostaea oceani TaxID=2843216 RepID=UPI001C3E7143|nr:hypothetical protein [Miltoncostaea oceani]